MERTILYNTKRCYKTWQLSMVQIVPRIVQRVCMDHCRAYNVTFHNEMNIHRNV